MIDWSVTVWIRTDMQSRLMRTSFERIGVFYTKSPPPDTVIFINSSRSSSSPPPSLSLPLLPAMIHGFRSCRSLCRS